MAPPPQFFKSLARRSSEPVEAGKKPQGAWAGCQCARVVLPLGPSNQLKCVTMRPLVCLTQDVVARAIPLEATQVRATIVS